MLWLVLGWVRDRVLGLVVPGVAGQQPRGHTQSGQHTTSAGAYNVKLAKSHVLKMSALVWGFPKNAKQRAAKDARGFLGIPIRVHSF